MPLGAQERKEEKNLGKLTGMVTLLPVKHFCLEIVPFGRTRSTPVPKGIQIR